MEEMDTKSESVADEAELPGDKYAGDEGEGKGDNGEAVEEMGDG